jgi:voltage-gated potassium channel
MASSLPGANRSSIHGPALAIALLVVVFGGGTLGYIVIERWSAWDAFYMTVITVTTVGYREVHDLSLGGQAFTVVLLFGGVGSVLYTLTLLATIVVEGGVEAWMRRRREARMLATIDNHFIVCGYGRIGSIVAGQFRRQGVPLIVVERDPGRCQEAIRDGFLTLEADASREDILRQAGIDKARGLVAVVGTDAENVYAVLSARVLRPDLFIIGRAETEDSSRKLHRAGADRVISPYRIGAIQIAQTAIRPAVVDFIELATSSDNLELALEEIAIAGQSAFAGRSILAAGLRQRFGVIVVGIQRPDRKMDFNPEPDTTMRAGDTLVVLGHPDSLRRLEEEAAS